MAKHTKFKPGVSGCREKQFQPGNPHRWQPGQSGNPSGIPRSRLKFEQAFYTALIEQGAPIEAASVTLENAESSENVRVALLPSIPSSDTQRATCVGCRAVVTAQVPNGSAGGELGAPPSDWCAAALSEGAAAVDRSGSLFMGVAVRRLA